LHGNKIKWQSIILQEKFVHKTKKHSVPTFKNIGLDNGNNVILFKPSDCIYPNKETKKRLHTIQYYNIYESRKSKFIAIYTLLEYN